MSSSVPYGRLPNTEQRKWDMWEALRMGGRDPSTCAKQALSFIPPQLRLDYLDPIGQDRAGREVMTSRSAPHGVICHRCSQAQRRWRPFRWTGHCACRPV